MRIFKRIILFPVYMLVAIMLTSVKALVKAECWVAGVGFLLLAILAIMAIIKHQWLQVEVFAGLAGFGIVILFLSVNIEVWLDEAMNKLK